MKAKVKPSEKPGQLKENLEKRVESIERNGEKLEVETDKPEVLERTPGIESFTVQGEESREGLKGRPVQEQAYIKLTDRKDVVKALLATIQGYNLLVLNTGRNWDLRQLKKYNPDIKHIKSDEPLDELQIDKTLSEIEGLEKIDIEMPPQEEIETIYREMLT